MLKPTRSEFIQKLHDLLEHPYDPQNLHWTPDGESFVITVNDAQARRALSTKWEFRSLSSFIRQLSYYGFRRLSDRRRSGERKNGVPGFIVFAHPSGFFVRGNTSSLTGVVRKLRNRPTKRRVSASSAASNDRSDESPPPPVPVWDSTDYHPHHRSPSHPTAALPTFNSSFGPARAGGEQPAAAASTAGSSLSAWKAYTPQSWSFNPLGDGTHSRSNSVSEYKISAPISGSSNHSLQAPGPHLRRATSSLAIQTSTFNFQQRQQQRDEDPPISPTGTSFRPSPYPTPTFTAYTIPSGAAPYDPQASTSANRPSTGAPYSHYSDLSASAQTANPDPSPSYSSDGEHTSHQQHMDPRSLFSTGGYLGGGGVGGSGGHYFQQRAPTQEGAATTTSSSGWAQPPSRPMMGSINSGYGSFSRGH